MFSEITFELCIVIKIFLLREPMLLYRRYFLIIVRRIEIVTDWLTGWLTTHSVLRFYGGRLWSFFVQMEERFVYKINACQTLLVIQCYVKRNLQNNELVGQTINTYCWKKHHTKKNNYFKNGIFKGIFKGN